MSADVNWSSITYPLSSAYSRNCFVNVRYLRRVDGAILAPSRMARKAAIESAIVMRPSVEAGMGFFDSDGAVPGVSRFPGSNDCFGFVPVRFADLFPAELTAQGSRRKDETSASFPAAPPLFKLARTGVFGVSGFAFQAVSSIKGAI